MLLRETTALSVANRKTVKDRQLANSAESGTITTVPKIAKTVIDGFIDLMQNKYEYNRISK